MVVYDLICSQSHHFEGWFENLEDLENQLKQQLLSCPVCGDMAILRKPSTFGLVKKTSHPVASASEPAESDLSPNKKLQFLKFWRDFSEQVEKEFVDVGSNFADEALKIHYGATDRRNIRGQSSDDQEKMLRKEGVEFLKMPILSRKNTTSNNDN